MKQTIQRLLGFVSLACVTLIAGCSGFFVYPGSTSSGGGSNSGSGFVYVANAITGTLSGFAVGTGTLAAVANSPYGLGFQPTSIAINPSNTILYVAGNSQIYAYTIGSAGALTAMNNGAAVAIANVVSMDISPSGQWLFALDANGVSLNEYEINSTTGLLTQLSGAIYSIPKAVVVPREVRIAPNGSFVFAALGTAGDLVFTLNQATGVVAQSQQLTLGSSTTSDNALAVDTSSTYLYVARSGTSGGLAVYTINSNSGGLNAVAGSPFPAGTQPYSVALNSAGTDVYVANRGDSTISGFNVSAGGVVSALSGSPYASGTGVTGLATDHSGKYLFAVADGGSPDLTMYSFDSTVVGKLISIQSVKTGVDPTGPVAIVATH
ncbi:MAG: hypothetical protein NVS9B15_06000 [Acidobacteriaceae bacterium]